MTDDKIYGWHDLLVLLDTTGASSPISHSVPGMLTATSEKHWLVLGALGRNAAEIARLCNDNQGEHVVMVFQAIAEVMQGRAEAGIDLLNLAARYFKACPAPHQRQNQGVVYAIAGLLAEAGGHGPTATLCFVSAAKNIAIARLHFTETGDMEGYERLSVLFDFLFSWIERAMQNPDCWGGKAETEEDRWAPITCPAGDNGGVAIVGRTRSV